VKLVVTARRKKLVTSAPYCSSTYSSIEATCPNSCVFKNGGCYASAGFAKQTLRAMDHNAKALKLTGDEVIAIEATEIDATYTYGSGVPQDGGRHGTAGRDLRLHVGGDVSSTKGALMLAGAAARWLMRGGGTVWTYTHRWERVPRDAWGVISVLASVEDTEAAERAHALGYAPALVVAAHKSRKAYDLQGVRRRKLRVVPCPAETGTTTCVKCRLCLDQDLHKMGVAIGFAAHGLGAHKVRLKLLPQLPGIT
jgi:hypothetical protein